MAPTPNKGQHEQDDKNEEQDLGDGGGSCRDAKESEDPGDNSYYQKDYCPA
jgi:hypothetical protein